MLKEANKTKEREEKLVENSGKLYVNWKLKARSQRSMEALEFTKPQSLEAAKTQITQLGHNIDEHAYTIGKILIWVKQEVGHGHFLPWIKDNVWFGEVTARRYVTFAKKCDQEGELLDYTDQIVKSVKLNDLTNSHAEMGQNGEQRGKEKKQGLDEIILHGDFREVGEQISDRSVNAIFTDPPWGQVWLPHWDDLGKLATRVLVPGGFLFTYLGKLYLPQVMSALSQHLEYSWLFTAAFDKTFPMEGRNVLSGCNIILAFFKPPMRPTKWAKDTLISTREKDFHKWQQSEGPFSYLIENFTEFGDQVCDPCAGGGTTLAICKKLGRKCIGIELKEKAVKATEDRLAELEREAA